MEKNNTLVNSRPPIVVVLGHVDHGKTTLLDTIRKTSVATGEAGGITQAIGASVIETKEGKKITFIDTPGHAAFTDMRGRGAKVADIALLVVAMDDGVKPQTMEALQIIRSAKIPFVVVGTKSDVQGVSPEKLLGELEKEQVFFEGRGGDTPFVSVSSKMNQGIDNLLEMISLLADVAELKGDLGDLEAVVIESGKKKMGVVATVVVRNGSIKIGDTIYAETYGCKVRALFNDKGDSIRQVLPGEPAQIFGFSEVPPVGALVLNRSEEGLKVEVKKRGVFDSRRLKKDEVPVIIKANSAGSLEAVIASLPPKAIVVDSGVGDVNSSDVISAKTGNAYIFAFESKIPTDVARLADAEKVRVGRFSIIYELLEAIEEVMKKGKVETVGTAEILADFPFNNKRVAGAKVVAGRINKGDNLILARKDAEIGKSRAASIRKQKQEVGGVGQSEEFGIIMEPQLNFEVGDTILAIR
jgi:translation initiation factor IF-2